MIYPKAYYCFQGSVWSEGRFWMTQDTSEEHEAVMRKAAEGLLVHNIKHYPNAKWVDVALWDDEEECMTLSERFLIGAHTKHFIIKSA